MEGVVGAIVCACHLIGEIFQVRGTLLFQDFKLIYTVRFLFMGNTDNCRAAQLKISFNSVVPGICPGV